MQSIQHSWPAGLSNSQLSGPAVFDPTSHSLIAPLQSSNGSSLLCWSSEAEGGTIQQVAIRVPLPLPAAYVLSVTEPSTRKRKQPPVGAAPMCVDTTSTLQPAAFVVLSSGAAALLSMPATGSDGPSPAIGVCEGPVTAAGHASRPIAASAAAGKLVVITDSRPLAANGSAAGRVTRCTYTIKSQVSAPTPPAHEAMTCMAFSRPHVPIPHSRTSSATPTPQGETLECASVCQLEPPAPDVSPISATAVGRHTTVFWSDGTLSVYGGSSCSRDGQAAASLEASWAKKLAGFVLPAPGSRGATPQHAQHAQQVVAAEPQSKPERRRKGGAGQVTGGDDAAAAVVELSRGGKKRMLDQVEKQQTGSAGSAVALTALEDGLLLVSGWCSDAASTGACAFCVP
jgi:hypothetical protein